LSNLPVPIDRSRLGTYPVVGNDVPEIRYLMRRFPIGFESLFTTLAVFFAGAADPSRPLMKELSGPVRISLPKLRRGGRSRPDDP
jgi:hypothetical protein